MPNASNSFHNELIHYSNDLSASSVRIFENVKNQIEMNFHGVGAILQGNPLVGSKFIALSSLTTGLCIAINAAAASSPKLDIDEGDRILFEIAKKVEMDPNGRAAKHLDHFLSGSGSPIYFGVGELLREDAGVCEYVNSYLKVVLPVNSSWRYEKGTIPVKQSIFRNEDWRLAIGSFVFDWSVGRVSSDSKHVYVSLSGSNEYRWHPSALRFTRCLHVAGEALTKHSGTATPAAKNFMMIALPDTIDLGSR